MAARIPLSVLSTLFLCATIIASEEAASQQKAQQTVVVRGGYASAFAVRENVDPQDPVERFVLLLPGGPVVVEAVMTIDGQPFRVAREKLIREMVDSLDKDQGGTATWHEALKNARFTLGRVRIANDSQQKAAIKTLDRNENGQVDRVEVRQFIAQYFQGPAFALGGYGFRSIGGNVYARGGNVGGGQAAVRRLLDSDNDGVLNEKEIAAASTRLKSRDADDNDLLYSSEIAGGTAAGNTKIRAFSQQSQSPPQLIMLLGPTTKAESLFQALQQRYKNDNDQVVAGSFATVPKLFEMLDRNKDGKLGKDEVLGLNEVKPHVELNVDLGKTEGARGLTLKSLAPEFAELKASGEAISVELPGIRLSLVANLNAARTTNYDRTAQSYLTRYDKDSNGYLDADELGGKVAAQGNLAQMMDVWDADADGKVYAKEIVASYLRIQAPQQSQIRANAANQGDSLFQALDQSGDGRLSLREMRTAHQRIKTFDENKDNRITQDEIPVTVSVTFGLGIAGNSAGRLAQTTGRPATSDAPEWFNRMDRNSDGDVTLKEFLGSTEEFKKLDTNGDGFIEPNEAKAARKTGE